MNLQTKTLLGVLVLLTATLAFSAPATAAPIPLPGVNCNLPTATGAFVCGAARLTTGYVLCYYTTAPSGWVGGQKPCV
jgi:hypothetical protein